MKKGAGALGLGLLGAVLWLGPSAAQQIPVPAAPDVRFAGLQWTFVRIRYTAWTMPPRSGPMNPMASRRPPPMWAMGM